MAATLLGAVLLGASPASAQVTKAAAPTGSTWLDNLSASLRADHRPHPAVVRVLAPDGNALYAGSGTLVAVTPTHGLVVTNWHVIRDGTGTIWVVFPDGFRSIAAVLRTDRDWDLAALAIARPAVQPVPISAAAPQIGESLTIAGYGGGSYRAVSGRCVGYVAPDAKLPNEFVQLSVAARQGDSGGPILNSRGELAGVLFGADFTETTGAYGGRVRQFLLPCVADLHRLGAAPNGLPSAAPILARSSPPQGAPTTPAGTAPSFSASPAWQVADVAPPLRSRPFDPSAAADPSHDPVAAQWPNGPDDPRMQGDRSHQGTPTSLARSGTATNPPPNDAHTAAGSRPSEAALGNADIARPPPTAAARNPAPARDSSTPPGNLPASIATQPGGTVGPDAIATPYELGRNLFALVGVLAVFLQVLRMLNPGQPRRRR